METQVIADALSALVVERLERPVTVATPPVEIAEILSVYFAPPGAQQSEADYRGTVLEPVAVALATALKPWSTTVPMRPVIGAASCARVQASGLAMRVTESRQFDERVYAEGRVELRAEVGVA